MRICTLKLASAPGSSYSQSRAHEDAKLVKELPDDYDLRTWRSKMHVSEDGNVVIPAAALTSCIQDAAKMLQLRIPGKGTSTYTKHFERGLMITEDIDLGIKASKIECERIYCDANGQRGSGKRVWRRFPVIPRWNATVSVVLIDSTITTEVFERVVREAGQLVGIGRYRPQNRGTKGRFVVESLSWADISQDAE